MTRRPLRRSVAVWRLLVHRHETDGPEADFSFHVQSDRVKGGGDTAHSLIKVYERTEFDELVVGRFLHVESLGTGEWWINAAGVELLIKADRDGNPKSVLVQGPGDAHDPVEGCEYRLEWSVE